MIKNRTDRNNTNFRVKFIWSYDIWNRMFDFAVEYDGNKRR